MQTRPVTHTDFQRGPSENEITRNVPSRVLGSATHFEAGWSGRRPSHGPSFHREIPEFLISPK